MKSLCIVVSPERTGGATVKELSSPDEREGGETGGSVIQSNEEGRVQGYCKYSI